MSEWKDSTCKTCYYSEMSSMSASRVCRRFPPSIKRDNEGPHHNPIDFYPIVVFDLGARGLDIREACAEYRPEHNS